jgi:NAD(P)-dependent dehydrogenase (short-subunit alcohol dehydrogenase family)
MSPTPVDPSPAVVITGTSTGIGRAATRLLDREGWRVFAGVRREQDAESLRAECSTRVFPLLLDVSDGGAIEQAAKDVAGALGGGGLAGLVNNAGIGFGGPLEFVDLDEMRRGFEVNVFGPTHVTKAFLPLLRRAKGRVVNVGSGAGKVAMPLLGPYCASKFALEALSDALRVELRRFGMHVVVIEPGFVDTPMQAKGRSDAQRMRNDLPEEARTLYDRAIEKFEANLERFGANATPPEAVARAIAAALLSPRPHTRYTVGRDAKLLTPLSRLLPDRAKDAIFGRLHDL